MTLTAPQRAASVVKASTYDVPRLSLAMARAYEDDPAGRWLFPEASTRLAGLERMFGEISLPDTLLHEETYTTAGIEGGALWVPPGKGGTTLLDELRALPKVVSIWGRHTARALRSFAFQEARHPEEPHYYLWLLGVDPARQGQGIGTALMRPALERADEEGMPAYLEATSPRGRDLSLRNGFEVTERVHWPGGGPPLWLMWREPGG